MAGVARSRIVAVAVAAVVLAATSAAVARTATQATPLVIVALGDSDTTGSGDPTHLGWVGRYARLLRQKLQLRVSVTNLAVEGNSSAGLLQQLRSDRRTRLAVAQAEIVLLGAGGADLNAGDDRWQAGGCEGKRCYAADLRAFARNFERATVAIRALRGTRKTVLRAITLPNALTGAESVIPPFLKPVATTIGVYQAAALRQAVCASMARHQGRCVDVLRAVNGVDGTQNGYAKGLLNLQDCCYLSAAGQQLVAKLLFDTGLRPVRS